MLCFCHEYLESNSKDKEMFLLMHLFRQAQYDLCGHSEGQLKN